MARLDRLKISGLLSIASLDLALEPLNVLIGANGSGKSNLVSAFHLLNQLSEKRLQSYVARLGGADSLLHFGRKRTPVLSISVESDQNGYMAVLEPTDDGGLFFEEEKCWFWGNRQLPKPFDVLLGVGHTESRLRESPNNQVASHTYDSMRSWRVYDFHDTSRSAAVKQPGDIADYASLNSDASNLAAFLLFLREEFNDEYLQIVQIVRRVAPFFHDFLLEPEPHNDQRIRLRWYEVRAPHSFSANALSDGTLRFICLTTLLHQPQPPALVVIDEPELGLHPYAVMLLASMLRSASQRMQVFVATQSVTLVNHFHPDDIIVVDRVSGASEFHRPGKQEVAEWLDDYGVGDLWQKNILGGRPRALDAPRRHAPTAGDFTEEER